ncbi:MAG: cytochrome b/b6 domain-containing protein [Rhodothermaceae bacterium]|nr:cytochrome b/b6 domain-containing protein [Rhodothermaceae bacterium]
MKRVAVYDLPVRLFHWLFAFFILAAFIIAKTTDDDSQIFIYHMMAGLTVGFLLVLRIIWGFAGTRYSRFSSLRLSPAGLMVYLKDAVFMKAKRYLGHNPASSYAAVIMFLCAAGLIVTGILMTGGRGGDFIEDAHELLSTMLIIAVIVHLGGVALHQMKHRDAIWLTMFNGKKEQTGDNQGIRSTRPFAGILFFLLTFLWIGILITRFNRNSQTVDLFGYELNLGDDEQTSRSTYEKDRDDEDDDHD